MYKQAKPRYRKLKGFRRFTFVLLTTALAGSITCFAYSELKYQSVSAMVRGEHTSEDKTASLTNGVYKTQANTESNAHLEIVSNSGQSVTPDRPEIDTSVNDKQDKINKNQKNKNNKSNKRDKIKKKPNLTEKEFFKTALFIGNSITEGFARWGGADGATFYSMEGLNVNSFFSTDKFKLHNKQTTPNDAVSQGSFDKVFLMFGINEIGWRSKDAFIKRYVDVIEAVKEKQPNAEIYVQGMIYVTDSRSKKDKLFNNPNIEKLNKKIKKMASDNNVNYIDLNIGVCDGKSYLPSEASTDGIHLSPKYCKKWKSYLLDYFDIKQ